MENKAKEFRYSWGWNLILLTIGSIIFVVGINGIVIHQGFITGGAYGACLLIYYKTHLLTPGYWYFLINIPLCILGWLFVSKRFVLYSIYAVLIITLASELIKIDFGIHQQIYAAIAGGFICGAGGGVVLRSLGSAGGLDIVAVILNKYFNIGIGKVGLVFNFILFSLLVSTYGSDIFIASIILVFVSSSSLDYFLSLFNQRKVVYVVSDQTCKIADVITQEMKIGATFIKARGAYSGKEKDIIMTITNNLRLKRLEEAIFTIDSHALVIVENSYDVIGSTFGRRKIY